MRIALSILQHMTDNMISGIKGIATCLDNIRVVELTEKELKMRTEYLFERITDYCFHLRLEKYEIHKISWLHF